MVNKLFISYSHVDTKIMDVIQSRLSTCPFEIWTDETMIAGTENWHTAIQNAIEACDIIILLMSPDSKASHWVAREIQFGLIQNRRFFPILIRGKQQESVPYALAGMQFLDYSHLDFETLPAETQAMLDGLCKAIQDTAKLHLPANHPDLVDTAIPRPPSPEELKLAPTTSKVDIKVIYDPAHVPNVQSTEDYVHRDELINEIQKHLRENHQVLLHGIGGVGKSSLAAEIAKQSLNQAGKFVVWLQFGKNNFEEVVDALFAAFPDGNLDGEDRQSKVYRESRLKKLLHHLGALLVLDDIWDEISFVKFMSLMPSNCQVLATSRFRIPARLAYVAVGELSHEQGITLFRKVSGLTLIAEESIKTLCESLSMHALAIRITALLLRAGKYNASIPYFLEKFKLKGLQTPSPNPAHESLYRVFEMSLEQIPQHYKPFLQLISQLYSEQFSEAFLQALLERLLPDLDVQDCLWELQKQDLLGSFQDEPLSYQLQGLFFAYLRQTLPQSAEKTAFQTAIIEHTAQLVDQINTQQAYQYFDEIDINLSQILGAIRTNQSAENHPKILATLVPLAQLGYFDSFAHHDAVVELLTKGIKLSNESQNKEATHLLQSKYGNILVARNQLDEALRAYQAALASAPSAERQAILQSVTATVYVRKQDYASASAQFALAEANAKLAETKLALSIISEHRGFAAYQQKDYSLAENEYRRSQEYAETLPEPLRSQRLFFPIQALGVLHELLGDCEKAIGLHQELLELAQTLQRQDLLADAQRALAWDFHICKQGEKAREFFNLAISSYKKLANQVAAEELKAVMTEHHYSLNEEK